MSPRGLAAELAKLMRPIARRRGFGATEVLTRWPAIVGPELARHSCPEKLTWPAGSRAGGRLRVRVEGAFATELQHLEPIVVERINTHYGYRAVTGLKLVQAPLPRRQQPRTRPIRPLGEAEERALAACLEATPDAGLRAALLALGRSLRGRER